MFFALTALLAIFLISFVLSGQVTPKAAVFTHGALAVTGLVLLVLYAMKTPGPVEAIILFFIAALGGLVMVWRDLTNKGVPKWLAVTDGLLAVVCFGFLLAFTLI